MVARTGGGPSAKTYTLQDGTYTKIGNRVIISFKMTMSAVTHDGTGENVINGIPFTPSKDSAGSAGIDTAVVSDVKSIYAKNGSKGFRLIGTTGLVLSTHFDPGTIIGSVTYRYDS